MTSLEARWHGVFLENEHIGDLQQRGDYTRFSFADDYWDREERPVLGAWFEDNPGDSPSNAMIVPTWFSNLLPEGRLRQWVAEDRGVSSQREMELLLQIGHDLPGAVVVREGGAVRTDDWPEIEPDPPDESAPVGLKFSLAGVGMKFSMVQAEDHLVLPAGDALGDWIVKLPDIDMPNVPSNEAAMMSLASQVGLDVPEHKLVHRDQLNNLPAKAWHSSETLAYAVRRFDRESGRRIHIEDFAQVRNVRPGLAKYDGTFETVAALCYRGHDLRALQEWARRVAFNLAIGNGDAHLKNWSLIYPDRRRATLSPVYDLVSTVGYLEHEDFGLKFTGAKDFERIRSGGFAATESKLGVSEARLEEIAHDTVRAVAEQAESLVEVHPEVAYTLEWVEKNARKISTQLWG